MHSNLNQFIRLRDSLRERKRQLEQELQEIEAALGEEQQSSSTPVHASQPGIARRGRPPQGGQSLKSVVLQVLQDGPMSKEDILRAVQRAGYAFSSRNPANSLGVILYGKNPRFERVNGMFGLPKGFNSQETESTSVATEGTGKRRMSAAGRARIAAAARARWAKLKSAKGDTDGVGAGRPKPKRTMSPAARKRIAEAARKRWAAAKAAGKKSL